MPIDLINGIIAALLLPALALAIDPGLRQGAFRTHVDACIFVRRITYILASAHFNDEVGRLQRTYGDNWEWTCKLTKLYTAMKCAEYQLDDAILERTRLGMFCR